MAQLIQMIEFQTSRIDEIEARGAELCDGPPTCTNMDVLDSWQVS